jgi:hypothetical protein
MEGAIAAPWPEKATRAMDLLLNANREEVRTVLLTMEEGTIVQNYVDSWDRDSK